MTGYLFLFLTAFLSATLLPSHSEIVLVSMITFGKYNLLLLLVFASIGNILGSVLNYYIGRYLSKFSNSKYLKPSRAKLEKAIQIYQKYGKISLLFAWVPIIGDPLTVIAGFFKLPITQVVILVSIGKILRYIVVIFIALQI